MPRRLQANRLRVADLESVAVAKLHRDARDPARVARGPDDRCPILCYEGLVPPDVVAVVVCVEHKVEAPPELSVDEGRDGFRLGRVDDGGRPRLFVDEDPRVVVAEARDAVDSEPARGRGGEGAEGRRVCAGQRRKGRRQGERGHAAGAVCSCYRGRVERRTEKNLLLQASRMRRRRKRRGLPGEAAEGQRVAACFSFHFIFFSRRWWWWLREKEKKNASDDVSNDVSDCFSTLALFFPFLKVLTVSIGHSIHSPDATNRRSIKQAARARLVKRKKKKKSTTDQIVFTKTRE